MAQFRPVFRLVQAEHVVHAMPASSVRSTKVSLPVPAAAESHISERTYSWYPLKPLAARIETAASHKTSSQLCRFLAMLRNASSSAGPDTIGLL